MRLHPASGNVPDTSGIDFLFVYVLEEFVVLGCKHMSSILAAFRASIAEMGTSNRTMSS